MHISKTNDLANNAVNSAANTASRDALSRRLGYLAAAVAILAVSFGLRLIQLYNLPVFVDEAHHLVRAHQFAIGQPDYPIFMNGKFLLGVYLAFFQPQGPAALWLGRAAEAVASLLSCAACIALGRRLGSVRAGLLAGLLYAVLPYAVFHDRQVLADPLMADFGTVALYLIVSLARTGRRWLVVLLGAALALSFAAKLTGSAYLYPLALAALLLPAGWQARRKLIGRYLAAAGLAALFAAILFLSLRHLWGINDNSLVEQNVGFIGCPPLLCQGNWTRQLDEWRNGGAALFDFLLRYFGWPLLGLAAVAWLAQPPGRRGPILWLTMTAVGLGGAMLALAKGVPRTPLSQTICSPIAPPLDAVALAGFPALISLPPRYYSYVAAPLAVLGALGLLGLSAAAARLLPRVGQRVWLAAFLLITLWPLANSVAIVLAPAQADLSVVDRWQYFASPYAGPGFRDVLLDVQALDTPPTAPLAPPPLAAPSVVLIQDLFQYVRAISYDFDPARIQAVTVTDRAKDWTKALGAALLASPNVYLVDEVAPSQTGCSLVPGMAVAASREFPRDDGLRDLRLQKAGPAGPALRAQFFTTLFTPPDQLAGPYQALAQSLAGTTDDTVVLAYPPNQAAALSQALAANPHLKVYGIGDSWPLDEAALETELAADTSGAVSVKVVFLEEQQGDPQRRIETWLNTHLFRVGQTWFSPLRVVDYAGAADLRQAAAANVQFGDAIVLDNAAAVEQGGAAGLVRVRLTWHARAPVSRPYKVFAHLIGPAGLVAQYDAQPVGELRPTSTWQVNEAIGDQFALRLPANLAPGSYELHIGLYELDTLARLPALVPGAAAQDDYVAGQIIIH